MTQALNKLISGESYIVDPHYLDQLRNEIITTAGEVRAKEVDPETTRALAGAVDVLLVGGDSPYWALNPVMEAATATGDPQLLETADKILHDAFPINETMDPDIKALNERSRREHQMALSRTSRNRDFGRAIASAEALNDQRIGDDHNDEIIISNWLTKQQREGLKPEDEQLLNILLERRRRNEERQKLAAKGVENKEKFDDAEPYNPLADDEDESAAA